MKWSLHCFPVCLSASLERILPAANKGSYGIGPSIAKAIVTAHKGKSGAGLSDGKTLVISVFLPA